MIFSGFIQTTEATARAITDLNAKLKDATVQLAETSSIMFTAVAKMAASIDTLAGKLHALILVDAPNAFSVLADITTALGEGRVSLEAWISEVTKLQATGAGASGMLGDLNKLILDVTRKMNALNGGIEELQQGAGEMDWGGPGAGAGKERPQDQTQGAGAGIGGSGGGAPGATSTGGGGGPNSNAGMTLYNEVGGGGSGIGGSGNIHVKQIVVTAANRARILRELRDKIRSIRR